MNAYALDTENPATCLFAPQEKPKTQFFEYL